MQLRASRAKRLLQFHEDRTENQKPRYDGQARCLPSGQRHRTVPFRLGSIASAAS